MGLYYNCDEQFVRGHRCQRLFYIEVDDYDFNASYGCDDDDTDLPVVSLHAFTGIRADETM